MKNSERTANAWQEKNLAHCERIWQRQLTDVGSSQPESDIHFELTTLMKCKCQSMPDCLNYGEERVFAKDFELVGSRDWLRLYLCHACNTYWQLDVDDRSDWAIKVLAPADWESFDDRPYRRAFIVRTHGGEGDEMCLWDRCRNRVLKDMAICVDHAFPEFAQEKIG